MDDSQKSIKRRSGRFVTKLKAHYFLSEKKGELRECTIFNISPIGIGAEFHEKNEIGSGIHLMIDVPGETQHVIVKGSVKWIRQKGNRFIGGIEFVALLDNVTFSKLS
jgi:hypothetical protein